MNPLSIAWPFEADDDIPRPPPKPLAAAGGRWGVIHHPMGYTAVPIPGPGRRPLFSFVHHPDYEFTLGRPDRPELGILTYQHPDGRFIRPDRHFITDFMTSPGPYRLVVPRDRYAPAVLVHDSTCEHEKVYVSDRLDGIYLPQPMGYVEAAAVLGLMVRCSGSWRATGALIDGAVRRFGPRW